MLVARDGDLVIGHLQIVETNDAGVFELKNMAVKETRQRQGIGHSLVEAGISSLPRPQRPSFDRRDRNCGHRPSAFLPAAGLPYVQNCARCVCAIKRAIRKEPLSMGYRCATRSFLIST